jgi:SOUL heme-binding protein
MANGVAIGVGTAAGVAVALVAAWHALTYIEVDKKCEKPKYAIVRTLGTKKNWLGRTSPVAEIRRYAPVLVAEVTFENMAMREALSNGFRAIAGFIFGKNVAPGSDSASSKVAMTSPVTLESTSSSSSQLSEKIAMTAPVTAEAATDGTYKVSFIMPSKYTKETLPKPVNDKVIIKEVPARTLAALTWSGKGPNQQQMDAKANELRAVLAEAGVKPVSSHVHLWQYHPPFAPAWMRRNEVLLEVNDDVATS